jgi:hypothetical protein
MFSNMPAAIATRVGPIGTAIVFEVIIYAPFADAPPLCVPKN